MIFCDCKTIVPSYLMFTLYKLNLVIRLSIYVSVTKATVRAVRDN